MRVWLGGFAQSTVMALFGLMTAGCASQQGRVESSSIQSPTVSPPPVSATSEQAPAEVASLQPPAQTRPPVVMSYPKTIQESKTSPAVLSLYRKAQDERAANHPEQAIATLERAEHIEQHNAFVWQALAGVNLDLRQPEQAESAANKSTSLSRGNPYLISGNWRIIAAARQSQGDSNGAMQAQAQADQAAQAISATP